jgi:hypothetical protein
LAPRKGGAFSGSLALAGANSKSPRY